MSNSTEALKAQPDAYNRRLRRQLEQEWSDLQALKLAAAPQPQAAQQAVALTDADLLEIAREVAGGTTIKLTRDVGPYEVTEPTYVYRLIADALVAKFCRVNGIHVLTMWPTCDEP